MLYGEEKPSRGELTGAFGLVFSAIDYMTDAAQRSVLFWDVMRQRGNQYHEHLAETIPHVLHYSFKVITDGRTLDHAVNYGLTRIVSPPGLKVDETHRPFVFIDPRAGHGPGIGGFKPESEIGVALKAGYPCYFIGFLPQPMPGQTIEDIMQAEALFLEKVIALHPQAEGKPCVVGNCQAGWAVMMLAALRPELFGPIILAGSPLSYWAGARGQNPMRYSGGLLGGSWLTAFLSDLGQGKFDGAWLVQNFENLNPSNTLWSKQYNLYAKIDTEARRYLSFERWWGGHVDLNAEEIQFIVDELFIGNKLAAGLIKTSDGVTIDLRNIQSPIIVFCSDGDNITPPQQALGWILDLYDDVDEIKSRGRTIIYAVHARVGHLGIFVSSGVAQKEHDKFSSNIDHIDMLPPSLFEAKFVAKGEETANPDLATGNWVTHYEHRTLDDVRALVGNNIEDDRRFATAARLSEANLALYRTYLQPWVRSLVGASLAEWMRQSHPLRLQYELLSDANPLIAPLGTLAQAVREHRRPAAEDNPFIKVQESLSQQIVTALDIWRGLWNAFAEWTFLSIYGSPILQAAAGIDPTGTRPLRRAEKDPLHRELMQARIAEVRSQIATGGLPECLVRALIYMGAREADERGIATIRRLLLNQGEAEGLTFAAWKALVQEQSFILRIDTEAALAAIPSLLPADLEERRKGFAIIQQAASARGEMTGRRAERLRRLAKLFGVDEADTALKSNLASD